MKSIRLRAIVVGPALIFLLLLLGALSWYSYDRVGMFTSLCNAGLPNFSRPPAVRASDIGCVILGPKRRIKGVFSTAGWEGQPFIVWYEQSSDNRIPPLRSFASFVFNQIGPREQPTDKRTRRDWPGVCVTLYATTVDGWLSVTGDWEGPYGNRSRVFFEERSVEISDPPKEDIRRAQAIFAEAGIADCSCQDHLGRLCNDEAAASNSDRHKRLQ